MSRSTPQPLDDLSHASAQASGQASGVFDCYAMLRSSAEGRTKDGKPYVDIEISDQTTAVRGKIWHDAQPAIEAVRDLEPGRAVKLRFECGSYKGALQLNIKQLRAVTTEDADYRPAVVFGEGIELVEDLICKTLVFDIETVPATDKRKVPATIAESLGKYADRKEMDTHAVMGLSPFFGKVISLAFGEGDVDIAEQKVTVLVVPPPDRKEDLDYPDWIRPMTEVDLLRAFWVLASASTTVVTYNGRGFDVPFLITRSLVHVMPERVDLISNRYTLRPHLDLYQVLAQAGRDTGPRNLDTVCWALGIESPKGKMDGSMVAPAYEKGNIEDIAVYNRADVTATTLVYQRVRDLVLRFRTDW